MAYYNFKTETSTGKAYYLGTLTSGSTMNVAAKYAGYANLTADNFVIVPQSAAPEATATATNYVTESGFTETKYDNNYATYTKPTISYTASTGSLTFTSTLRISGYCVTRSGGNEYLRTTPQKLTQLVGKVYLLPEIEEL